MTIQSDTVEKRKNCFDVYIELMLLQNIYFYYQYDSVFCIMLINKNRMIGSITQFFNIELKPAEKIATDKSHDTTMQC